MDDLYQFEGALVDRGDRGYGLYEWCALMVDNEVLIQMSDHILEFNLFVRTNGHMHILPHDMPHAIILLIGSRDGGSFFKRRDFFNYWYNQFDPQLKEFDEIKYLFEQDPVS